jgi:hypothetical protein
MDGCGEDGRRPCAVFMAFGTYGDVFPIAVRPSSLCVCWGACATQAFNITLLPLA